MLGLMRATSLIALLVATVGVQAAPRVLSLDDLERLSVVSDPRVSPDGLWVVYAVSTVDGKGDKRVSHLWMTSWDGTETIQLTFDAEGESSPRWSPDGRYLAFESSRPGPAKGSQVWLMDRRGGEARQLTAVKDELSGFEWSPDSKRLVLLLKPKKDKEEETKPGAPSPKPKPIIVDRYHFKQDREGYLSGTERTKIYLYDMAAQKAEPLTSQTSFDERSPAWSPDGTKIAFVSNQDKDWDRTENTDIFVTEAKPGGTARKLTHFPGPDTGHLSWSPDSKRIAYLQGSEPELTAYNEFKLAVVAADGGEPRVLTARLDRAVSAPLFSRDGRSIVCIETNDRREYPIRVSLSGGGVTRMLDGDVTVIAQDEAAGHYVVLATQDDTPAAVFALENGALRKMADPNALWIREVTLGRTRDVSFHTKDGTEVHGLLTLPPGYRDGSKVPLLLRIHGGPDGEDSHAFQFERQLFAANGYAVLNVNYRGSSGRGAAYQKAIFADWGHREVEDLLAGVDAMVSEGVADPARLGIGGWSYGGILTDYTIASDGRFRAAISGAGSANQISMYGLDEYVFQYDHELGPPWRSQDLWLKLSYPFFHADRIHTPTLFLGGDKDMNVPLAGGEQMYEALQSLGVPSELIIYPGAFHGITRPSYVKDRFERYLAWYGKYVKGDAATSSAQPASSSAPSRSSQ